MGVYSSFLLDGQCPNLIRPNTLESEFIIIILNLKVDKSDSMDLQVGVYYWAKVIFKRESMKG